MYRLLILLLALTACTGSYEPPAPSFLAVASGQRIDFYLSTRLRPDVRDDGQSPLIGSWTNLSLPVLDLYFKLKQSDQQNNRLWVLDREKLTAYSTDPFFENLVPNPTTLDPRSFAFTDGSSQPVDCSQGYLSASPRYLLVVCPPVSGSSAPYSLYLVDFNQLQAGGVLQTLIGPIRVQTSQAVFTLTSGNALVILNGASSSMEYHPDPQMPANETGVIRGGSYNQPLYAPQELIYDSAGNRVFGLLRSSTNVRLLTWNLKADTPSDVGEPDPNGRNPDHLQSSSANLYALSQQGLFRVQFPSGTLRLIDPPGDLGLDALSYLGSALEDGRLLYLAAEDPSANQKPLIVVLNSQKPLESLLSSDVKVNSNNVQPFSSRPVSLSIFPVQER
ncbi:hypothetical protein [Calidithermus timidus]|uniref:hypothetical protein n=1 Tax=Calidithermus timidus TaxID=307124 RepID=UPI00039E8071|nr:hypothetical protein [Calidithermus timidus]